MNGPEYITIPRSVIEDTRLSHTDGYIYGFIFWCQGMRKGKCIMSNTTIGALSGIGERQVRRSILRLEEAGHIKTTYASNKKLRRLAIKTVQTDINVMGLDKNVSLRGPESNPNKNTITLTCCLFIF